MLHRFLQHPPQFNNVDGEAKFDLRRAWLLMATDLLGICVRIQSQALSSLQSHDMNDDEVEAWLCSFKVRFKAVGKRAFKISFFAAHCCSNSHLGAFSSFFFLLSLTARAPY